MCMVARASELSISMRVHHLNMILERLKPSHRLVSRQVLDRQRSPKHYNVTNFITCDILVAADGGYDRYDRVTHRVTVTPRA